MASVADSTIIEAAALKEAGTALYKEGEFAKAGGKYADALRALPPPPASADAEDVRQKLRLNLAQCYLRLNSFGAAEAQCEAALAAEPECAKALFRRGQARLGRDALPEALADLLSACKLDPRSRELRAEYDQLKALMAAQPELANRLQDLRNIQEKGLRYLHTGRADEALTAFALVQRECDSDTVAVHLPQWEAAAALGVGLAHRGAGRRSEALAALERALDRAVSEHARAPVLAVHATIALCLLALDDPRGDAAAAAGGGERARAQLTNSLIAAEGLGDASLAAAAHSALACVHLRAGRLAAALPHARAALDAAVGARDSHAEAAALVTLASVERRLAASGGAVVAAAGVEARLVRALELARALRYPRVEAEALVGLARLRLARAAPQAACDFAAEAVRLGKAHGLALVEASAIGALGAAALGCVERRLPPPPDAPGADAPCDRVLVRASELAARLDVDAGAHAALLASAHVAAVALATTEPDAARRAAKLGVLRKLLIDDVAKARALGLKHLERTALGSIGVACLVTGDALNAIETLEAALSVGDGDDDGDASGAEFEGRDDLLSNLGVVHMALGATARAAALFGQARASARARAVCGWRCACYAGRQGMALAAGGDAAGAFEPLHEAVQTLRALAPDDERAAYAFGCALTARDEGRAADAAAGLEQAFLILRALPPK